MRFTTLILLFTILGCSRPPATIPQQPNVQSDPPPNTETTQSTPIVQPGGIETYQIIVVPTLGKPSDIEVRKLGEAKSTTFKNDDTADTGKAMKDLNEFLKVLARDKKKDELPKLEFMFHDDVLYVWLIKMMDDCRLAGHENVHSGGFVKPKR